ncbi:hypothetical protein ACTXG7_03315 [Mycolicibacterium sp. Dal123E01]|uniref:hypothetical protein n=1 Tax=Mycolicibacterium sp. Dal123E01 TaxID=3457578 RepID=UPI00403E4816
MSVAAAGVLVLVDSLAAGVVVSWPPVVSLPALFSVVVVADFVAVALLVVRRASA